MTPSQEIKRTYDEYHTPIDRLSSIFQIKNLSTECALTCEFRRDFLG